MYAVYRQHIDRWRLEWIEVSRHPTMAAACVAASQLHRAGKCTRIRRVA
jgi:hypothetical protein